MENLTKEEILKKFNEYASEHYNVHFATELFGPLEFNQLSNRQLVIIDILLKESVDDETFAKKLIYDLIVNPNITLQDFFNISDAELISIVRQIIEKNDDLRKIFGLSVEDDQVLCKFRLAVKSYYNEKVTEIKKNIEDFTRLTIDGISSQFKKINEIVTTIVIPKIDFYQSWIESNRQIFENINKSFWYLQESLGKFGITVENANNILIKYKWFISPSLPASFYKDVIDIEKSGKHRRKQINQLFIGYLSKNDYEKLENIVDEWKENLLFKPRMRIFKNCLITLRNTRRGYNPSLILLPVLISQIDGVLIDFIKKHGFLYDKKTRQWKSPSGQGYRSSTDAYTAIYDDDDLFSELPNFILLNVLFQQALPGIELKNPTTFSRHKIMHGEFVNYGNKEHVFRAFLILDFLSCLE